MASHGGKVAWEQMHVPAWPIYRILSILRCSDRDERNLKKPMQELLETLVIDLQEVNMNWSNLLSPTKPFITQIFGP